MKSLTRVAISSVLLLTPAFALAQTFGMPGYTQQPSYTQQSTTFFSGGTSFFGSGMGTGCVGGASIVCIGQTILYLINAVAVPLLFAIAFIVFIYGVFLKYIYSHGDTGKVEEGHKLILWGLIGFAVMVSVWGLVNVVVNTTGLSGYRAPQPPVSYPY